MKKKYGKIAFLLLATTLLALPVHILRADNFNNNRYLVESDSIFWKNALGTRHVFQSGFTTTLTAWQVRLVRFFGLSVEEVSVFSVLPNDLSGDGKTVSPDPSLIELPTVQYPWNIQFLTNRATSSEEKNGATVAILDTGVLKDHPDIARRVKQCKDFSHPVLSLVEDVCEDQNGHGTHLAGVIAADGGEDGQGLFGIAPASNLFVYKTCSDDGQCFADDIAAAMIYAADEGASIINLSLGQSSPDPLLEEAIAYARDREVLIVAAAGNDGPYKKSIDFPALHEDVIAVGAFDVLFEVPEWSSRGSNEGSEPYTVEEGDIELVAPGVNVESLWKDGTYAILSGTSIAAAHISGLAAYLWQGDATLTRKYLHDLALDIGKLGDDDITGFGVPVLPSAVSAQPDVDQLSEEQPISPAE